MAKKDLVSKKAPIKKDWTAEMYCAVEAMMHSDIGKHLSDDHKQKTPMRVVTAYRELFRGVYYDPAEDLNTMFPADDLDMMITMKGINIYSMCAHHLLPFFGHATFSYIPDKHIIGLSKQPRFIDTLCRRPQTQEHLTKQITKTFMDVVKPRGCAVMIRAFHCCMMIRGVKEPHAYTETTVLAGIFKEGAKAEFLQTAQDTPVWGK